jgi:hypothetical protein
MTTRERAQMSGGPFVKAPLFGMTTLVVEILRVIRVICAFDTWSFRQRQRASCVSLAPFYAQGLE